MKKYLLGVLLFTFLLAWCTNNTEINNFENINQKNDNTVAIQQEPTIKDILKNIIKEQASCNDDSELFVNIVLLWNSMNDKWNTEYYLVSDWQWFYIDERWDLNNSCGFGNIPTTIELDKENNLVRYEIAKDWNEYDSSTKEMFSEEAYDKWLKVDYDLSDYISALQQAENYFNIKLIPEWKNDFECGFCDKTRYRLPNNDEDYETNDLIFNYTAEDNWNDTIYFGSDWSFEDNTNRELNWKWTWTFGKDPTTIIVEKENVPVYSRYIITNLTNNSLWTILEIIQK